MFIVLVIVYSNCHILQVLHQIFNVSALLLDDALKPATPMTNGAINENQLIFDEVQAYKKQESPADARVTCDSAIIPKWPPATILDIIEPQIAPFNPPTTKTIT